LRTGAAALTGLWLLLSTTATLAATGDALTAGAGFTGRTDFFVTAVALAFFTDGDGCAKVTGLAGTGFAGLTGLTALAAFAGIADFAVFVGFAYFAGFAGFVDFAVFAGFAGFAGLVFPCGGEADLDVVFFAAMAQR
jgi:hypothetical protein